MSTNRITEQIKSLTPRITLNTFGLPEGIYRPDLLPALSAHDEKALTPQLIMSETKGAGDSATLPAVLSQLPATSVEYDREVKAAYVPLNYVEGYPTLDGMPFWSQLSFESPEAYLYFLAYLEQGRHGARQLFMVLEDPRVVGLPMLPTLRELEDYFHIYYWAQRVKAHDLFFAAHRRKERERRAIETEDYHYLQAARLMGICEAYLDDKGEELIETMTPKAFIEFLKTAVQIQRMSVGMSANGDKQSDNAPAGASTEFIMRTLVEQSQLANGAADNAENASEMNKNAEKTAKFQRILQNPDVLKMAQEIIIRTTQPVAQGAN